MPRARVHTERFASAGAATPIVSEVSQEEGGDVQLSVIADGKRHEMRMHSHQRILDVALQAGLDLPYSCKGGVCCTCRAKVLEGEVEMHINHALEDYEVRQGYVLTCQCYPLTDVLRVSYDQ